MQHQHVINFPRLMITRETFHVLLESPGTHCIFRLTFVIGPQWWSTFESTAYLPARNVSHGRFQCGPEVEIDAIYVSQFMHNWNSCASISHYFLYLLCPDITHGRNLDASRLTSGHNTSLSGSCYKFLVWLITQWGTTESTRSNWSSHRWCPSQSNRDMYSDKKQAMLNLN